MDVIAVVVGAVAVVAAGASVAGAAVVVSASSTKELGSHMENHSFSSAHVKPLAQQVLPCQPCPPHCSQASAQVPLLGDGTAVVVGEGLVVAEVAGAIVVAIAVVTEACAVLVGAAEDSGVVVATGVCGMPPPCPNGSTAMSAQFQNSSPKPPLPLEPQQVFSQVTQESKCEPCNTQSETLQPCSAICLKWVM